MPAAKMHQMGDTPKTDMSNAATMGIQKLNLFSFAFFAILKQGARMSATTLKTAQLLEHLHYVLD